jgi:hypothetical protein
MKTKSWVLTTLVCFIAAIVYATDFPQMNVVPVEAEKALIAFDSPEPSPLEITLTNHDGEILYYKKTKKRYSEYKTVFDFAQLGVGNYCVCVNFGNKSITRKVDVSKDEIHVGPPQRLYEAYFYLKDKKLNVSLFNCPQKQVYVNVYKDGKHVTGLKLGKGLTIQKRLDLSRLEKGEYEIVLTDYFKDHVYIAQL